MNAHFNNTRGTDADFGNARVVKTYFNDASLGASNFKWSNIKYSSFINASLIFSAYDNAVFYETNFKNAQMTRVYLKNAWALDSVVLPNRTIVNTNLLMNNITDCGKFLDKYWVIKTGNISVSVSMGNPKNCRIVLRSHDTGATLFWRTKLSEKWDFSRWSYSRGVLSARMSLGVSLQLNGINSEGLILDTDTLGKSLLGLLASLCTLFLVGTQERITLILDKSMDEIEVFIKFNQSTSGNSTTQWCEDIRLFILYDAYGEFQQSECSDIQNIRSDESFNSLIKQKQFFRQQLLIFIGRYSSFHLEKSTS